jgi:hypothetical protein
VRDSSIRTEPIRLNFSLVLIGGRVNEAHFRSKRNLLVCPAAHLASVNICVYEPSVFRVLVNWPRAPKQSPSLLNSKQTEFVRTAFVKTWFYVQISQSQNPGSSSYFPEAVRCRCGDCVRDKENSALRKPAPR